VNYVPYFYEYEGIIPLLLTNNSGINGAKSKRDFDPTLLMNQSIYNIKKSYMISNWERLNTTRKIGSDISKKCY